MVHRLTDHDAHVTPALRDQVLPNPNCAEFWNMFMDPDLDREFCTGRLSRRLSATVSTVNPFQERKLISHNDLFVSFEMRGTDMSLSEVVTFRRGKPGLRMIMGAGPPRFVPWVGCFLMTCRGSQARDSKLNLC
jgi:hypothetical protein